MQIVPGSRVTIRYHLFDAEGELFESSEEDEPAEFVYGNGEVPPGLERALDGKSSGDKIRVELAQEDAFGEYMPEGLIAVPRGELPDDIELGDLVPVEIDEEDLRTVHTLPFVLEDDKIVVLTGVGGNLGDGPEGDAATAEWNHPTDVAWLSDDSVVMAAWHNSRVAKFDKNFDTVEFIAGTGDRAFAGDGGPATEAECSVSLSLIKLCKGQVLHFYPILLVLLLLSAITSLDCDESIRNTLCKCVVHLARPHRLIGTAAL